MHMHTSSCTKRSDELAEEIIGSCARMHSECTENPKIQIFCLLKSYFVLFLLLLVNRVREKPWKLCAFLSPREMKNTAKCDG